ncbi:MAG: hypothetical protein NTX56_08175 [Proteobacteria bacterium]|nr:hypothetical protein [Pseudomonadota bacterium]
MSDIVIHLMSHRRRALELQSDAREAEVAYDDNISAYIEFLREEAAGAGYSLTADDRDHSTATSYHGDASTQKAAHDWLHTLPDIWNWIP